MKLKQIKYSNQRSPPRLKIKNKKMERRQK